MIVVIGLWTFLRAWLLGSTTIALENLALRHQPSSSSDLWADHACHAGTESSGSGCPASGRAGGPPSSSSGPPPSWRGTAEASSSTGGGSPGSPQSAVRSSTLGFAISSGAWLARSHLGPPPHPGGTRPTRLHRGRAAVAKYMHRTSPRPSPTWRAFLATHAREIIAVDFLPRADPDVSPPVRLRRAPPRPP
jgi:hypothetical protein